MIDKFFLKVWVLHFFIGYDWIRLKKRNLPDTYVLYTCTDYPIQSSLCIWCWNDAWCCLKVPNLRKLTCKKLP